MARMTNVRRFNWTSPKSSEHSGLMFGWRNVTRNRLSCLHWRRSRLNAGRCVEGCEVCHLLAAVRSVAAANFESDERSSAARDVGQEAQRAGVVLEGKARLCIATSELSPGFGDRGNAVGSPELGGLGSDFTCVQFKSNERE